jgi:hypothetical protein
MLGAWTAAAIVVAATAPSPSFAQSKRRQVAPPPIITPTAPAERYGDWSATHSGDGLYFATTTNATGAVFGVMCSDGSCISFVNPTIACEEKAKYPALINSPGGSFFTTLSCRHVGERNLLVLEDDSNLVESMEIGGVLGIAVPMQSGEFRVSRFSLTGALKSVNRIASLSGRQTGKRPTLNDESL